MSVIDSPISVMGSSQDNVVSEGWTIGAILTEVDLFPVTHKRKSLISYIINHKSLRNSLIHFYDLVNKQFLKIRTKKLATYA